MRFACAPGASVKLVSGPFVHAQNWSRGFYDTYGEAHGLYYRSSMTNRPVVVLYERANHPALFPTHPVFHRALADPVLYGALVMVGEEIGYGLLPLLGARAGRDVVVGREAAATRNTVRHLPTMAAKLALAQTLGWPVAVGTVG